MSELVRRLQILTPEVKELRVPPAFMGGVGREIEITPRGSRKLTGASPKEVAAQADDLSARFAGAKEQSDRIASTLRDASVSDEDRDRMVAEPFDDLVSQVRQYGKEDGGPTVLAGIASALLRLDDATRDMVLRRAGNPRVFDTLRGEGDGEAKATEEDRPETHDHPSIYKMPTTSILAALIA